MSTIRLGYEIPTILFPEKETDLSKWSVVACDQYTSQKEYWEQVERLAAGQASTLYLMLPEAWLKDEEREAAVAPTMERYLREGVLRELEPGMIWVKRGTSAGDRRGLVMMLDLEAYDYARDSVSLIRATEATVEERLPARVRVRSKAVLEMPHIMVLVDDAKGEIAACMRTLEESEPFYNFPLMMNSGEISGWKVNEEGNAAVEKILENLAAAQGENPMLFAVGDGNHSLAAAKLFWKEISQNMTEEEKKNHPARFALAEVVNLHDPALVFEPIHRLITGVDAEKLAGEIMEKMRNSYGAKAGEDAWKLEFVFGGEKKELLLDKKTCPLPLRPLQALLDEKLAGVAGSEQDYIHGDDTVRGLAQKENSLGILVPALDKMSLFSIIRTQGSLPRKCFSMGEAQDKRFYLECRALTKGQEVQKWE